MTDETLNQNLQFLLAFCKVKVLQHHGFYVDEILEVQEYEFTFNSTKGTVEYLEIWKDQKRSRDGYRLLTIPEHLQKQLGGMAKNLLGDKF